MFELLFLDVYRDMTDAKELLELRIYGALRKSELSESDYCRLKNNITTIMYDFSINEIKNTEIVKASTNKTDELLEYFIMTKASEKMSRNSIDQYVRVIHQLCNLVHKELNEMPKVTLSEEHTAFKWVTIDAEEIDEFLHEILVEVE